MKQEVKIGYQDYSTLILIRDTAGAPKTALTYASAGLDFCYVRVETDNDVVLTDGAPVERTALTDAHTDWGFIKVDDTKCPGLYRIDLPDGVFATGAWSAVVCIVGTGLDPTHLEFILVPEAPYIGTLTATNNDKTGYSLSVTPPTVAQIDAELSSSHGSGSWEHPTVLTGTVVADAGNSATVFKTNRTEAITDHWKDSFVCFTTGTLTNQVKRITAYNGSTKVITVRDGFTEEPAENDTFVIVNR